MVIDAKDSFNSELSLFRYFIITGLARSFSGEVAHPFQGQI
jgi:hypothetical protein